MTQVTRLRRTLESAGYVEVTPRNEEIASDYLMYVNNAEGIDKKVTIEAPMVGSFDRDPNTTAYNEGVLVSNGKLINAMISSGDALDAPMIGDPESLQRVVRVEYLDADKEFPDSDPEFFYRDGVWFQGSRTTYKTIMKRGGFDGKLNLRVHYPRIISGCRLLVEANSDIYTSDVGGETVVRKEKIQTFDLGTENLLGGYIDIQVSLFDDMNDAKSKVIDKKTYWGGSYMRNIIATTLNLHIINAGGTVRSPVLVSSCDIFLQEYLNFTSVSTAFLEKLEVTSMNGEITVKFKDGAAHAQFRALANGYKGSNSYHELGNVGVSKGKRYVELSMNSLDPNAYVGIVRPEMNGSSSGYIYRKIIAVTPGKLWVNDEVFFESPALLLNSDNTYSFAIDMETGMVKFALNGMGWTGSDLNGNSVEDATPIETTLLWVPELLGCVPVTYGFAIGEYVEGTADGEVHMKARRSTDEFLYNVPPGYTPF